MSICEHMIPSCESATGPSPEEKLLNIQNELLWGLTYRNYKENEKKKPLVPIHSPLNIPFEICRANLLLGKTKKLPTTVQDEANDGKEKARKQKSKKRKKQKIEKPSLIDRNVWPQNKYMNYLSIPNPKFDDEEPRKKKFKKRCELEPCPPRFIQLAVPNKRRVFANWKEYSGFLPTEMLMRFEEILHTDQNLEPKAARYYYKKLDKQKRDQLRKKRRAEKKKKKQELAKSSDWLNIHIETLATNIVQYIQDEPLFALNYKQMLLSDSILERLEQTKTMKKPSRKTKNYYKKTIIEVSDKFAIWIDTLTKFVDVQAIESDVDIPPVSIPSLYGEGESEGESEYELSSEEEAELRDSQLFQPAEDWDEGDTYEFEAGQKVAQDIMEDILRPGEDEEGGDYLDDLINGLDGDSLERLIAILGHCSDDFLDSAIDDEKMPGVTYRDVLNKLKELKEGLSASAEQSFLEQIMRDWAIRNDPDKVDEEIIGKIHEVAAILTELLSGKKPSRPDEPSEDVPPEGGESKDDAPEEGEIKDGVPEESDTPGPAEDEPDTGAVDAPGDEAPTSEVPGDESPADKGPADEAATDEKDPGAEEAPPVDSDAAQEEPQDAEQQEEGEGAELSQGSTGFDITEPGQEQEGAVSSFVEEEEQAGPGYDVGEESIAIEEGEEPGASKPSEPEFIPEGEEIEAPDEWAGARLDGKVIKGHKPSKIFEHSPDTVCCLSLKTWAVWLLEITHNAHNWTQWMGCVIQRIREYASIVRGDVKGPNGRPKTLKKAEWRQFIKETEEATIAWRQYSSHVKDLSQSIVDNFHNKAVNCCPKCLQDHLITNVVVAHDTLQALTEAISCAAYWQRCLDNLVDKTCGLTERKDEAGAMAVSSEEDSSGDNIDIEDVKSQSEESGESVYEIEEIEGSDAKSGAKE